jgi:hypothetical protein
LPGGSNGGGLEDFLAVLDAERTLHAAEMSLSGAQQNAADSFIALVKALGGDRTSEGVRSIPPQFSVITLYTRTQASSKLRRGLRANRRAGSP